MNHSPMMARPISAEGRVVERANPIPTKETEQQSETPMQTEEAPAELNLSEAMAEHLVPDDEDEAMRTRPTLLGEDVFQGDELELLSPLAGVFAKLFDDHPLILLLMREVKRRVAANKQALISQQKQPEYRRPANSRTSLHGNPDHHGIAVPLRDPNRRTSRREAAPPRQLHPATRGGR